MTLLHEIARCPVVDLCLRDRSAKHPCREIVLSQSSASLNEHQVPEPWSGHLEQAPILFLSSNPSISLAEAYPGWSWPDELIQDYFANRFGGGNTPWITQGTKSLQHDGTYSGAVAFWAAVRQRAMELLERDVVPGTDYALTEIVHCKSQGSGALPKPKNIAYRAICNAFSICPQQRSLWCWEHEQRWQCKTCSTFHSIPTCLGLHLSVITTG